MFVPAATQRPAAPRVRGSIFPSQPGASRTTGRPPKQPVRDIEVGERFGRLVTQDRVDGRQIYRCRCDCGTVIEVARANLHNGHTLSCGCLRRQLAQAHLAKAGQAQRAVRQALQDARSRHRRRRTTCATPGCSDQAGSGLYGSFCTSHAERLARIREQIEGARYGNGRLVYQDVA